MREIRMLCSRWRDLETGDYLTAPDLDPTRVKMGGHSVPEHKIVSRYQRSLDLLIEAITFTNRAYIFDNSTHEHIWLAEVTNGNLLEMKTVQVPEWFKKALGQKFNIGH